MKDPYLILGLWGRKVSGSLDDVTVKSAYQALLRQHPPERQPERFKEIRQAYEQLETHKKRLHYDLFDDTPADFEDLVTAMLPDPAFVKRPSLSQVKNLFKPN